MLEFINGHSFLVILILVFLAVILLLQGFYLVWNSYKGPSARKIEKRIRALSGAFDSTKQAQLLKERMLSDLPFFENLLLSLPRAHRLDRLILQAGLDWTVSVFLLSSMAIGITSLTVVTIFANQPLLTGVLFGAFVSLIPSLYVRFKKNKRLRKIEKQLPDTLDLLTRALKSGHAFSSGLQMIGEEMAEPIANEFRIVHDEVNFGVSLPQALKNLTERIPITDLRYFTVAVLVQRDSGGSLSEILGNLSRLIRERAKLISKVRVLSSEGRLSAWVLGIMPFFLAGLMNFMNPDFMSPLWTDPIGTSIIKYMLILMAIGILILMKIVKIRV
jgi:tight adherence protein B